MSFRLKTILGIALIESLLLILLIVSGMNFLSKSNDSHLKQRAQTTSILFSKAVKDALLSSDLATLESFTEDILTLPDIIYARISNNDFVLAEGGEPAQLNRPHLADQHLEDVTDGIFDIMIDISEGGITYGKIEIGLSTAVIDKNIAEAQHWAIIIASIEVCLVAIFSFILGTYLTQQLLKLKKASETISRSGPGHQITVSGKDEIADVANAFNVMSSTLAESYIKLSQSVDQERKSSNTAKLNQAQNTAIQRVSLDALITIDKEGKVIDYNPVAEATFGWTYEEVFGQCLADFIIPENKRHAHHMGMKAYLLSKESPVINRRIVLHALHKLGHIIPIEINIAPVETEQTLFFIAFIRDISARLAAETELRLAAQTFESSEAIFISNAQGDIIRINQAFTVITGYSEEDVIGQNPSILSSGHHPQSYYQQMWSTLLAQGCWNGEIYNKRKNGEIYPELLNISSTKDADGKITHFIAHFIDISEQKSNEKHLRQARREAEASNESKSSFLASMSHEIRTPMNAVLGILDLLTDTPLTEKQLTLISTARDSGELLMTIINDILDFTKMDVGEQVLQQKDFDLHLMLKNCIALLQHLADKKSLQLSLLQSASLPQYVRGDPDRIQQIFINLINNAIKFTENGSITVTVSADIDSEQRQLLHCKVCDTGIGIHADAQASLFDEFTMVDQSYSRKYEGTGLGLAICKRLIDLMHGTINIHSELGQGTTFEFTLVLEKMDANTVPKDITEQPLQRPRANTRILLAEDNLANQMVIKSILEHAELSVDVVSNGHEALQAVQDRSYEVILMDISMPEMDGMSATQAIRKLPSPASELPIIALTAHTLSGDKARFLAAGMNDYLSKPLQRKSALNCIARWTNASEQPDIVITTEPEAEFEPPYVDESVLLQLVSDTDAEIVPELISLYIEDSQARLVKIAEAIVKQDFDNLEFETHTVGSSAAAHGNAKLYKLSRKVEALCREKDHQAALKYALLLADVADNSFRLLSDRAKQGFT